MGKEENLFTSGGTGASIATEELARKCTENQKIEHRVTLVILLLAIYSQKYMYISYLRDAGPSLCTDA